MSMSLRDQLLQAGLINKKQANDAERQQQRQERQAGARQKGRPSTVPAPVPPRAQAAKVARDQALSRQQQEKADKKARLAQIKQLIEQNRLPDAEGDESYNFVDGNKIRRVPANAAIRARLGRKEIAIVRHQGLYSLVPSTIAARIRERDEQAVVVLEAAAESPSAEAGYEQFKVPDDLMW